MYTRIALAEISLVFKTRHDPSIQPCKTYRYHFFSRIFSKLLFSWGRTEKEGKVHYICCAWNRGFWWYTRYVMESGGTSVTQNFSGTENFKTCDNLIGRTIHLVQPIWPRTAPVSAKAVPFRFLLLFFRYLMFGSTSKRGTSTKSRGPGCSALAVTSPLRSWTSIPSESRLTYGAEGF